MSVSIRLKQDEPTTQAVLKYLADYTNHYILDDIVEEDKPTHDKNQDSDISDTDDDQSEDFDENSEDSDDNSQINLKNPNTQKYVKLIADYGEYQISYNDHPITIKYECCSSPIGLMDAIDCFEKVTVTSNSCETKKDNLELLKKFILGAEENSKPKKKDQIACYIADEGFWKFLANNPKRKIGTVFHPKRDELYQDVKSFNDTEADYKQHGIPYKRNYLFYGPPGTGKTSMLCALASEFNANLYMVNFTSKITDANFMRLVSKMPSGSIMVLEDIDALFTERVTNDAGNRSQVSFSAILNTLDGIARKNKMVTVMTTNFKDRLDEALIRPGRIDMVMEFPLASENQVKEMFTSYFGDGERASDVLKIIYRKTRNTQTSTAALQKYFFEHRHDVELLVKNIEKLTDLINQYHKTVHNLYI